MDPMTIAGGVGQVLQLAKAIYDQVELAKANKKQCRRLAGRVKQICDAIEGLGDYPNERRFYSTVLSLQTELQETQKYIKKFSGSHWMKRTIFAKSNQEKFAEINGRLAELLPQLNVGLAAHLVFKREEDEADAREDRAELLAMQGEILEGNQRILREVQSLRVHGDDLTEIIAKQMASMQAQFMAQLAELSLAAGGGGGGEGGGGGGESKEEPCPLDHRYTCEFHEITFLEKLTEGSFGKIFRGEFHSQEVVVKLLPDLTADAQAQFIREVKIMSRLRSRHVVQFYAASLEPKRACIVMEYMHKDTISHYLSSEILNAEQKHALIVQLARGLTYLHSQDIVHADIKPENALISQFGEAKWTDFGLSRAGSRSVATINESSRAVNYHAPECFDFGRSRDGFQSESDVYAFAVLMWQIWTGEKPYDGLPDGDVIDEIKRGVRPRLSEEIPEPYRALMVKCWQPDTALRPSMEEVTETLSAISLRPPSPSADECYEEGVTAERSRENELARTWYERARRKGHVKALTQLGFFSLMGKGGMPRDKRVAHDLFRRAATSAPPHPRAMMNVAEMLYYGDGVPEDKPQALVWYERFLQHDPSNVRIRAKIAKLRAQGYGTQAQEGGVVAPTEAGAAYLPFTGK